MTRPSQVQSTECPEKKIKIETVVWVKKKEKQRWVGWAKTVSVVKRRRRSLLAPFQHSINDVSNSSVARSPHRTRHQPATLQLQQGSQQQQHHCNTATAALTATLQQQALTVPASNTATAASSSNKAATVVVSFLFFGRRQQQ